MRRPELESVRETEAPQRAWELCDNRMVMGIFRYGPIADQRAEEWGYAGLVIERVRRFEEDGNTEHLLDAMNILRILFYKSGGEGAMVCVDDGPHSKKRKAE